MVEFVLDLEEIDRDVALLKLTDAAGISLEHLPEKLSGMAALIRSQAIELKENSKRAQLQHDTIQAQIALLKEARDILKDVRLCACADCLRVIHPLLAKLDATLKS